MMQRRGLHDSSEHERAATRIQANFKAYRARRRFKQQQNAARLIQSFVRGWQARRRLAKQRTKQQRSERFEAAIDRHRQRIQVLERYRRELIALPAEQLEAWEDRHHQAASVIQAHWRGYLGRKRYANLPHRWRRQAAAKLLQRSVQAKLRSSREASRLRDLEMDSPSTSVHWAPDLAPQATGSPTSLHRGDRLAQLRGSTHSLGQSSDVLMASISDLRRSHLGDAAAAATNRRKILLHQIDRDVRERTQNPMLDHVDAELLGWRYDDAYMDWDQHKYSSSIAEKERQRVMQQTEVMMGYLEQLPTPSELPDDTEPHQFSLPPNRSTRWAAAKQAHALALAEARVGGQWWRHLKPLNRRSVHETWQDDEEREWRECMDVLRAAQESVLERERERVLPAPPLAPPRWGPGSKPVEGFFVSLSGLVQPDRPERQ